MGLARGVLAVHDAFAGPFLPAVSPMIELDPWPNRWGFFLALSIFPLDRIKT
jgi:hypothetical protein